MQKTGTASLPLHGGSAPRWLFDRMVKLSGAVAEAVIEEHGQREFLERIAQPTWFQALSCAIGFDWHSSGTTTTTCGALKVALEKEEAGVKVCGGKGRASRRTPLEIREKGEAYGLGDRRLEEMEKASRLSAKVDNSCIQDGYQLYHHCLFLNEKGEWAVVQQGMNESYARRYHWIETKKFMEEPHTGICCEQRGEEVLDLTAKKSTETRDISLDIVKEKPERIRRYFSGQQTLEEFTMPRHHPVLDMDIGKRDMEVLKRAYELQPEKYEELVLMKGMGPKKIRALALVADLVYGSKASWKDPVKYSFAHGGKDGYPYPVDKETYDHTIKELKDAIRQARIGEFERGKALKRLSRYI